MRASAAMWLAVVALGALVPIAPAPSPDAGARTYGERYRAVTAVTSQVDWPTYHGQVEATATARSTRSTGERLAAGSPLDVHGGGGLAARGHPVVVDGIMYVTAANECHAIDAGNRRRICEYRRPRTKGTGRRRRGGINHGVAGTGPSSFQAGAGGGRNRSVSGGRRRHELVLHRVPPRDRALLRAGPRECTVFTKAPGESQAGKSYYGGSTRDGAEPGQKVLRAIDVHTGRIAWEVRQTGPASSWGGVLATSGGLVFFGEDSGALAAADASSGKLLWHFPTNTVWKASPMTYMFDHEQYVAVAAGPSVLSFALVD